MKSLNRFESRLLFSLTSLLVLSACSPQPEPTHAITPIASPIPALVSPTESLAIATPAPTPEAKPTVEPTPTVISQEITNISQIETVEIAKTDNFSINVSKNFLSESGLISLTFNPDNNTSEITYSDGTKETLTRAEMAKRFFFERLAFEMTNFNNDTDIAKIDPKLKNFHNADQGNLISILQVYRDNTQKRENGFDYTIPFGTGTQFINGQSQNQKLEAKINSISLSTVSENEWDQILNLLKKDGILYKVTASPVTGGKSTILYIDETGKLHEFQKQSNKEWIKPDKSGFAAYLLTNLYTLPLMNTEFAVGNSFNTKGTINYAGSGTVPALTIFKLENLQGQALTSKELGIFQVNSIN